MSHWGSPPVASPVVGQRIKLASFIGRGNTKDKIIFIFDEPTTGLHFHDINKLLLSFNALIAQGHTVIVVEHNLDLIKCAETTSLT